VQPFPANGDRIQISTPAGSMPAWSADGRQIVYGSRGYLGEVDLVLSGSSLKPSLPRIADSDPHRPCRSFVMNTTGERFLVPVDPGETSASITVVVNWRNLLRK
jgi:hypothetical protein